MFTQKSSHDKHYVPGPIYELREKLAQMRRGFGLGNKIDLSKPSN